MGLYTKVYNIFGLMAQGLASSEVHRSRIVQNHMEKNMGHEMGAGSIEDLQAL